MCASSMSLPIAFYSVNTPISTTKSMKCLYHTIYSRDQFLLLNPKPFSTRRVLSGYPPPAAVTIQDRLLLLRLLMMMKARPMQEPVISVKVVVVVVASMPAVERDEWMRILKCVIPNRKKKTSRWALHRFWKKCVRTRRESVPARTVLLLLSPFLRQQTRLHQNVQRSAYRITVLQGGCRQLSRIEELHHYHRNDNLVRVPTVACLSIEENQPLQ